MGTLWCYAVAIDQVRDIFGAPEPDAAALRAIAADRFGRQHPERTGLLGKLGPVFRRPVDAPVVGPDTPVKEDCDRILGGRHVPPHRLAASWRLMQAWLEERARSSHGAPVEPQELSAIEFDLARAGVPAQYSVDALMKRDLGVAMLPAPGMAVGYCTGAHAAATAQAWRESLPDLEPETSGWVGGLLDWLGQFEDWVAAGADPDPPDLVAVLAA